MKKLKMFLKLWQFVTKNKQYNFFVTITSSAYSEEVFRDTINYKKLRKVLIACKDTLTSVSTSNLYGMACFTAITIDNLDVDIDIQVVGQSLK